MNFFCAKTKKNSLTVQIFNHLQNHPTFHSEERLVNLKYEEESALLVYSIISLWFNSTQTKTTFWTLVNDFNYIPAGDSDVGLNLCQLGQGGEPFRGKYIFYPRNA